MSDSSSLPTDLFDRLTLGVVRSLEKRPGVTDIQLKELSPAERHLVISWEQRNSCILPDDLKRFYLTSNGFHLEWSVKFEDQSVHLGHMEIHPVDKVIKLAGGRNTSSAPSLADVDYNSDDDVENFSHGRKHPHFDLRSRVFELDPCDGYGKVCLVYNNTKQGIPATDSEIWFLDRSLHWHFIADNFSQYFRLMIMNMGLPLWHFALTDIGLPSHAQQWFYMYAPLQLDFESQIVDKQSSTNEEVVNKIDVNKVFKGKTDKRSKSSATTSKKRTSSKSTSGGSVRATLSTPSRVR